jgi:hypothetical protein
MTFIVVLLPDRKFTFVNTSRIRTFTGATLNFKGLVCNNLFCKNRRYELPFLLHANRGIKFLVQFGAVGIDGMEIIGIIEF